MIYHITTERGWQIAREMGEYRAQSLKTEGFIHCSTREQVPKIADAFYRDMPNLVVLGIDSDKLTASLRWEAPAHPDGDSLPMVEESETFPHVYGPIDLDSVVSVVPLSEFLDR
ncbi:DUF952 domain-containing protein [Pannus brasiliensis CCIBt3594]|uniref:DUF952 domain-containing protein n=1 Tax=Pannus brasiliensis CCIBt3594 TaxID=1427578 RepID=A0AAW9QNJ0_9CHRO